MKKLEWIESGGGPLLFASKSLVAGWFGTNASGNASGLTDYQRACAVVDEIGVVDLAHAQAVVLGDEPDRTCLFEDSSDLFILRWRWAESEESLLLALRSHLSGLPFVPSGTFSTIAGEHVLFDSAYAGIEMAESLSVKLDASKYTFETVLFEPNRSICAVIHRLRESTDE